MADNADRNLPASAKKIRKARQEGNVPRSRDLGHFVAMGLAAASVGCGRSDLDSGGAARGSDAGTGVDSGGGLPQLPPTPLLLLRPLTHLPLRLPMRLLLRPTAPPPRLLRPMAPLLRRRRRLTLLPTRSK